MTQINITLGGNSLAKWDFGGSIILPDELALKFKSYVYKLENMHLMVTIRNRYIDKVEQFKANKDNDYTVDISSMIDEGELEIEISSYVQDGGARTKTWRVPNIICRKVKYEFEIIPELDFIRQEILETKKAINELVEQLKTNNILL